MTEIEQLEKAIKNLHACKCKHLRSVAVNETFEDQTVLQGAVGVFELENHPQAKIAYAWSYQGDDGKRHHVAVLGVPPINSPDDAVKAYVVADYQRKKS